MQTKKCHFVLAVLTAVLCLPALGDTKLLPPIKQRVIGEPIEPGLIGWSHLALAGGTAYVCCYKAAPIQNLTRMAFCGANLRIPSATK